MAARYYAVIVKVDANKFVKYRKVSKFDKFYQYLDTHFAGWRWGNVYFKGSQIDSFTSKNRKTTFSY